MATYNGATYVREQLESILVQLGPDDEVVIVDDASADATLSVIATINDRRVRVHPNIANLGPSRTFERALHLARGDIVVLADQDDVWPDGRLDLMRQALDHADMVVGNAIGLHNGMTIRPPGTSRWFRLTAADPAPRLRSIALLLMSQLPYHGCAMGFRRSLVVSALPFPSCADELHDAWLGMVAIVGWRVAHLPDPVVRRRLHDHNASGRIRGARSVVRGRLHVALMLRHAIRRRPDVVHDTFS